MTPQARIAAAISILNQLATDTVPVDRALKSWARANRYAGSKDRRAIEQHVYQAIRYAHHNAHMMGGSVRDGRTLMLGGLLSDGVAPEDISTLFDGSKFGPTSLSDEELARLKKAETATPLDGLPNDIAAALTARAPGQETAALAALLDRAPLDLRLNDISGNSDKALTLLEKDGFNSVAVSGVPMARRLADGAKLRDGEAYKSGAVEIQDAGSQIAAMLVAPKPGETVIDYCAGGGGKSLALAAMMRGKGQVFAYDIAAKRLESLARRADRAKARNIQIFTDVEKLVGQIAEMNGADHLVLDVPCSGSGAWRRNPETLWRFDEARFAELQAMQRQILTAASGLVKPGGALTYITCSFLPQENEAAITDFLEQNQGFSLEHLGEDWPQGQIPGTVQLMPHLTQTDGFFIAKLRRAC